MRLRTFHTCGVALVSLVVSLPLAAAAKIVTIGLPADSFSQAQAVSNEGNVVIGVARIANPGSRTEHVSHFRAFRWTPEAGLLPLAFLPGGGRLAAAQGLTPDGSIAVGSSDGVQADGNYFTAHATRWSGTSGLLDLGTLPGGRLSLATSVSADGQSVVGYSENARRKDRAVLWHEAQPARDLGTLGGEQSMANDISHDGSTVVGHAQDAAGRFHAFRWTLEHGMQDLGTLPRIPNSSATATSANGEVVVGVATQASTGVMPLDPATKSFIWRRSDDRMTEIMPMEGGRMAMAHDVSADGNIVIGTVEDAQGQVHAFRWTAQSGMKIEPSVAGTSMEYARALSPNGRFVVGRLAPNDRAYRAEFSD